MLSQNISALAGTSLRLLFSLTAAMQGRSALHQGPTRAAARSLCYTPLSPQLPTRAHSCAAAAAPPLGAGLPPACSPCRCQLNTLHAGAVGCDCHKRRHNLVSQPAASQPSERPALQHAPGLPSPASPSHQGSCSAVTPWSKIQKASRKSVKGATQAGAPATAGTPEPRAHRERPSCHMR